MATEFNRQSVAEVLALQPRMTLFVPTYNEEAAIVACLDSITAQDYPADLIEVLVVDGRSEDATLCKVEQYIEQLKADGGPIPEIRIIDNPARDLASAWNLAATEATGDFIGLVVAHSLLSPNFVSRSISRLQEGDVDVVGGPYRMIGVGVAGEAIAAAMSSRFGVGQSKYRWGGDALNIDSVANAVYPLELLRRFLPFDKSIGKGEDWDLHYRMRQERVRLGQYADIQYEFHARSSLKRLCSQEAQYAMAKVNIIRKHGLKAVRPTHFIPLLFVLWIIVGGAIAAFVPAFRLPWVSLLGLYGVCNLMASCSMATTTGLRLLPLLSVSFLCMHVSYGLGMLWGGLSACCQKAAGSPAHCRLAS